MAKKSKSSRKRLSDKGLPARRTLEQPLRERILKAAFTAFMERGYEGASTLEIATRANVSKRELYALFDNKLAVLVACITERAKRIRLSLQLPPAHDRETLALALTAFGAAVLREVSHPTVLAVFRLAIAEVDRAPQVAQTLQNTARKANYGLLAELLAAAQAHGLIGPGEPANMATQFFALLWGDLLMQLLLRVAGPPSAQEMDRMAGAAAEALLKLYPQPKNSFDLP